MNLKKLFGCSSVHKLPDTNTTSAYVVINYEKAGKQVCEDFNSRMEKILTVEPLDFNELETFVQKEKEIAECIFSERCGGFRSDLSEEMKSKFQQQMDQLKKTIEGRSQKCLTEFLLQENLLKAVEEGVNFYKQKMHELEQQKLPLTDSQIKKFHLDSLEAIKNALISTYNAVNNASKDVLTNSLKKLEKQINSQLGIYLMRQEILVSSISSEIQKTTVEAEDLYDLEMDTFIKSYGTSDGSSNVDTSFKDHHLTARDKALSLWNTSIEQKQLETYTNVDVNLLTKLENKYRDLVDFSGQQLTES